MYHWLAMGVTAQSVYIPFFPQGTKVPYMWGNGKVNYSPNSAYWIFKLAGVLVDRNWGKYGKELANAQTEAKERVLHLRYEYDQKLHADQSQATAIADEANAKMAKTVTEHLQQADQQLDYPADGRFPAQLPDGPELVKKHIKTGVKVHHCCFRACFAFSSFSFSFLQIEMIFDVLAFFRVDEQVEILLIAVFQGLDLDLVTAGSQAC